MTNKKDESKIGLFKTRKDAIKDAKQRRKNTSNDISPNFTLFYRVEKTKKPKNAKKPSWYVIRTARKKTKKSTERAYKNRQK